MARLRNGLAAAAGLVMFASAAAAAAADAGAGRVVAERWCSACHLVADDQARVSVDAPTFAEISANNTRAQIKAALTLGHTQMPDMALTRAEIDNLIAYIHTLAPPLDPAPPQQEKDDPPRPHRG